MKNSQRIAMRIAEKKQEMNALKSTPLSVIEKIERGKGLVLSYYNNTRPSAMRNELERRSIYKVKR